MYLLVGLGNPGSKYKKNRHNVGHLTVDIIAKKYDFNLTGIFAVDHMCSPPYPSRKSVLRAMRDRMQCRPETT